MKHSVDKVVEEFIEYVKDEELIRRVYHEISIDRNSRSNTFRKRMFRIREVLNDLGYAIPFKLYRHWEES